MMSHSQRMLTLGLAIAAVAVLVGVTAIHHTLAAGPPQKVETQWEYGLLRIITNIKAFDWDARPGGTAVQANSLDELYKKLGGPGELPSGGIAVFYNHLGSQGWEFVVERESGPPSLGLTLIWFKRPKT